MTDQEQLQGGNSNQVIKDGNTVIRNTGASSPFIHALLQYLTGAGFKESPRFIELIGDQERLSYFEGDVGNYPLKPYMQSETILIEAAQLLRRFHDLTQNFVAPAEIKVPIPSNPFSVYEVICHNDFAPYNCVFQSNHLAGVIDFDTATPGTRVWDVAYAVYRFVPLTNDQHSQDCGWDPIPDRLARLALFCDSYGLASDDREQLIATVQMRLQSLMDYMNANGSNLEHLPLYANDLKYIAENEKQFTEAITYL